MKSRVVLWLCFLVIILSLVTLGVYAAKERWPQKLWSLRPKRTAPAPGFYKVIYVYDGDTILINMDGAHEKVRFIGVDTPETHDPDLDVQCFGAEASSYTNKLLLNKSVRLESDSTNSNRDRYDRLLRYVYTERGELINKKLVAEGYGFAYVRFPFLKKSEFLVSEALAREALKGLWSKCKIELKEGVYQTSWAQ